MDLADSVTTPFGTFGPPPDPVAWGALVAGVCCAGLGWSRRSRGPSAQYAGTPAIVLAALFAAALSAGYVAYYLRGGPRIIDATSYLLQSRILATGHAAFTPPAPLASFAGRFLVEDPSGAGLAVLFPPGFALALAPFSRVGLPMALGPLLAALLVLATYAIGRRLFDARVGFVAAGLSVVCAALRYHTADTMAHGLAALALCMVLLGARSGTVKAALFAGLGGGWLLATRPVTGVVALAIAAALVRPKQALLAGVAGLVPGVTALLLYQHAVTGSFLESPQLAYYATADGPPGCFAYGFGRGIGCVVEHGDFVRDNLGSGYGFVAAAGTTLRRLKQHLLDAGNSELFFLLLCAAFYSGRRDRNVRLLLIACVGVVVAYAPFYFDGNYPGGGARFYADVLPLEHVAIGWLLVRSGMAWFGVAAALVGFSVHGVFEHRSLADREGGRPMFEARVLGAIANTPSLVFVDTDHGFNLGYRPDTPTRIARYRGDAHDWLLWDALGRPPAYRYRFDLDAGQPRPRLERYRPYESFRYEVESLWPPSRARHGWVRPAFAPCFSGGRALEIMTDATADVSFGLYVPTAGRYQVNLAGTGKGRAIHVRLGATRWSTRAAERPCETRLLGITHLPRGPSTLTVHAPSGWILDSVDLIPLQPRAGKR